MKLKKSGSAPKPRKKVASQKVRAKKGTSGMKRAGKVALAQGYVAAQATSPQGAGVATQAAALKTALASVDQAVLARPPLVAALQKNDGDLLAADGALDQGISDYATEAAKVAQNDETVLKGLGVAAAAQRQPKDTGPGGIVTEIQTAPGTNPGDLDAVWKRPRGAAAFMVQYKVEPATPPAPGATAPDWGPGDGIATKNNSLTIPGLPPSASVRLRVRSIGAETGPWSDEVLGKAR